MSIEVALNNIRLESTTGWAHTENSLEYHVQYMAKKGLSSKDPELLQRFYDHFGFDFIWNTNDGMVDWNKTGRTTDMGHAAYAADGSDQHSSADSPFQSEEEVWHFDAVEEYGLPDFDEQLRTYEQQVQTARHAFPKQLTPGGYYRTIVSGAIASFGWDMLLMAASDPGKMEKVFDSFFRRTLFHMKAWAQTTAPIIIQHDDFVWTNGAFMNPEIYSKIIIPRYAELWKPLHDAGKKVLFCSDGNYTEFAMDVANAGADGFIFEPCMDFAHMAQTFGQTHCLVGSFVDCRDLTFGTWEKVKKSLDQTFKHLEDCRGAIITVGNHLPPNIPEPMLDRYFEYLLPKLKK